VRVILLVLAACGGSGGSSTKPAAPATPAIEANACASAYAEYEARWKIARSEELAAIDFDAAAITEMVTVEVATLPKRSDVEKLRGQYTAIAVFLPDASWPVALDAASRAIDHCGEETKRP
jgi:hypothetical protein